ncbi:MAG: hypothetical protein R3A10_05850 [Caldilineaceae bacterium]
MKYLTLTFSRRRAAAGFWPSSFLWAKENRGWTYFCASDTECDTRQLGHVRLADRGQGSEPSVDLALDDGGRPRLAFTRRASTTSQGSGSIISGRRCLPGCGQLAAT